MHEKEPEDRLGRVKGVVNSIDGCKRPRNYQHGRVPHQPLHKLGHARLLVRRGPCCRTLRRTAIDASGKPAQNRSDDPRS